MTQVLKAHLRSGYIGTTQEMFLKIVIINICTL